MGNIQVQQLSSAPERPATAFLSYRREDAEQVKYLQQQLKVRGVRAWRDVTDLPLGGSTEDEIVHAIEEESDAFVIYITQDCLRSDFIWNIEVPKAIERWDRDHAFNIVPILRDVTFNDLQQFCAAHGIRSLTSFNAIRLPDTITGISMDAYNKELRDIARNILKAALNLRLQRVGASSNRSYEPYIYLQTFPFEPPATSLDLDLDWTELFPIKYQLPATEVWEKILFPALDDVKNSLSSKISSRKLHIFVQAHLPAAFALGFALSESAYFTLLLEGRHGSWSTDGTPADSLPLRRLAYTNKGDEHVAIMEIAISRVTAGATARSVTASGLSFKHHIRFELPDGPDNHGVKDASHALAMARQIGKEFRTLHDKEGVSHIHLFAALPAALAVMVGHQINAMGAISLYHYMEKDRLYQPVCTLGK